MKPTDIGKKLKKTREALEIDLQQAARETRIRDFYLEALEQGNFERLPSKAQVKGFIRSYARYLDLDEEKIFIEGLEAAETQKALPGSKPIDEVQEDSKAQEESAFAKQYKDLGKQLRARREILALSLVEVAEQTHIAERYLQWIEDGQHAAFPSPTQARGMLNNYAGFLGLEKEALAQFGDAVQQEFDIRKAQEQSLPHPTITERKRFRMPKWARRYLSADILVGVGLSSILAIIFIWGLGQVVGLQASQENPPTAPPLAELLIPSPSAIFDLSPTPTNDIDTEDALATENPDEATIPQITVQVANPSGVKVQLFPLQREWVRVSVDGEVEFEGRVALGETYIYTGSSEVLVYTGDAAAFRIFLNDQDFGLAGIEGEVITLLFTRNGLATPSSTPIPTLDPNAATETPSASETPQASPPVDGGGGAP